ncbi:MAG: caspase family protein, partial [Telluria sp.]
LLAREPRIGPPAAGRPPLAEALPPNGDFRFDWSALRVSADATRISMPMRADGGDVRTFDVGARVDAAYRRATAAESAASHGAQRTGTLRIEATLGDDGYKQPVMIGSVNVRLKPFQSVHSWAQAPRSRVLVLGTQWSLMAVDDKGKHLWEHDLPAPVYQVSVSADDRWVVAAVGDGSIRWYALAQGAAALTAFLHNNGEDWVLWRPDGYYASSPKGDDYFGWLTNRGDSVAPNFVRAVQVERELYRPDLLAQVLKRGAAPPTTLSATLHQLSVPQVTIESVQPGTAPGTLNVQFSAQAAGQAIRELGVYVDGIPVLRSAERAVKAGEAFGLKRTLTVPARSPSAVVRVEAETARSIGLDQTSPLAQPPLLRAVTGRLWLVVAGVDEFDSAPECRTIRPCVPLRALPNTVNDVHALAEQLGHQQGRAFSSINATVLSSRSGNAATKRNLLAALRTLEQAQPDDTVIVFLASHGFAADASSEYFFIPKDGTQRDLLLVAGDEVKGRLPEGAAPSLVSGSELAAMLRRVAGRRILLLDTCHSGAADGRSDPHALSKRSAAAQVAVLAASRGDEKSWESLDARHGAFTLALLEALHKSAGAGAASLTLRKVFDYSRPRVADNARRIRERKIDEDAQQTPTLSALPALEATVLALPPP